MKDSEKIREAIQQAEILQNQYHVAADAWIETGDLELARDARLEVLGLALRVNTLEDGLDAALCEEANAAGIELDD